MRCLALRARLLSKAAPWHGLRSDHRVARSIKLSVLHPRHPERVCWGCDEYCPADDLRCGNGSERTPHPCELLGEDWLEWSEANGAPDTVERLFDAPVEERPSAPPVGVSEARRTR